MTDAYDNGMKTRRKVLGDEYVDRALASADAFNEPMQQLVTEYCWDAIWNREALPHRTRSLLNIAMLSILNRQNELRAHLRGALRNGCTTDEIREVLLQVAVYGGVPAGIDSFRVAKEVLKEEGAL